jgi:hypothetical protein
MNENSIKIDECKKKIEVIEKQIKYYGDMTELEDIKEKDRKNYKKQVEDKKKELKEEKMKLKAFEKENNSNNDEEIKNKRLRCLEIIQRKIGRKIRYADVGTFLKKEPEIKYNFGGKPIPKKSTTPINYFNYKEYKEEWWVDAHNKLFGDPLVEKGEWIIRLELNLELMYEYHISIDEIVKAIKTTKYFEPNRDPTKGPKERKKTRCNFDCIMSPMNIGILDIYIDFQYAVEPVLEKVFLPSGKDDEYQMITTDNIHYFYTRDIVMPKLKTIKICGIQGITKIFPKEVTTSQNGLSKKEWVIDTQGSKFIDVLNTPGVDFKRTTCDDFWQVCDVLGIHAAGKVLFNEYKKVLSFDGAYINPRHIQLLVDKQIRRGSLTSVRREGINRDEVGPLAKGAFEKILDTFAFAGAFGEQDNMDSVSSRITMGEVIKGGTGYSDVFPIEKLEQMNNKKKIAFEKLDVNKFKKIKLKQDITNEMNKELSILFESIKTDTMNIKEIRYLENDSTYQITIECDCQTRKNIPWLNLNTFSKLIKKKVNGVDQCEVRLAYSKDTKTNIFELTVEVIMEQPESDNEEDDIKIKEVDLKEKKEGEESEDEEEEESEEEDLFDDNSSDEDNDDD